MAESAHLRGEERLGLGVALIAHAALFALLLWHASRPAAIIPPAERMTVSLVDEVSLESTAPDPTVEAPAAVAPVLAPKPEPVPPPVIEPLPKPVERVIQKPKPQPKPSVALRRPRASSTPVPRVSIRPTPRATSGGSRLGDDFLEGAGDSQTVVRGTPAKAVGAAERASIASAMIRQIKPHWSVPQGADADQLVTILDWDLNPDGSLRGRPRLVRQLGINDSNRPQASLHAERAIRAVQLAAPFDLPEEYYEAWKALRGIRFDRNL